MADRRKRAAGRRSIATRRKALEHLIEQAIEALNALDGDCDLEAEVDRCEAHDDDPQIALGGRAMWNIGSEDDCEVGEATEDNEILHAPWLISDWTRHAIASAEGASND